MPRPDQDRSRQDGFLLAEMLATMLISAFALVAMVGLGGVMLRAANRAISSIEATDGIGRTMLRLDELIREIQPSRLDGTSARLFLFDGTAHRLIFAHRIDRPGALPSTEAVTLQSEPNGRLVRREAALPAKLSSLADLHFGPSKLLYEGAVRFRFSYVGQASGKNAPLRSPSWPVGDRMPATVEIEALDVSGRPLASIGRTIVADADVICIENRDCAQGSTEPTGQPAPPAESRP